MEREKVLNGLRCHAGCERGFDCDTCDYIGNGDCSEILARDALNLLKEQEAVEPEVYYIGQDKYKFYRCPVCKTNWYYKGNYCLGCGRPVLWERR